MSARRPPRILAAVLPAAASVCLGGCAIMRQDTIPYRSPEALPGRVTLVEMKDRAAFEEGISLASQLKYGEAEKKFFTVLRWYEAAGDRQRTAETKFWLAFCYEKQGRAPEARELYRHIVSEYPGTSPARQAAVRLRHLPTPPTPGKTP